MPPPPTATSLEASLPGIGEMPGNAIEGVAMNARIRDARPPGGFRRIAGPVVRVLTQVLFLVAGLVTTVLGFTWFVDGYHAVGAYHHAPMCGTAAATPGTDCVLHETGKVAARRADNSDEGTTYSLTVARETAPKHTYTVGKAFYNDAKIGLDVDLAVFRGTCPSSPTTGTAPRTRTRPG